LIKDFVAWGSYLALRGLNEPRLVTCPPKSSADVSVTPDFSQVPALDVWQSLLNGWAALALLIMVAVIIAAGVSWGGGHATGNERAVNFGKRGVFFGAIGALVIGASPYLINYFRHLAPVCT